MNRTSDEHEWRLGALWKQFDDITFRQALRILRTPRTSNEKRILLDMHVGACKKSILQDY